MNLDTYWIRRALLATGLMTALAVVGIAVARPSDDCQRRVAKADHNLHEAIEHHGWRSPQADHWRHELAEARNYCWDRGHRWWDADTNRWRTKHDWDDHEHDFDRDHH